MTAAGASPAGHQAARVPVAGVLLTGGASTRMGTDKASVPVDGVPMAVRLAGLLEEVLAGPLLEVGPGRTGLPAVPDDVAGAGPLVAVATAARRLAAVGWHGPAVVLACDLPLLNRRALDLVARWPGAGGVVPVVGGRRQPLCARWSAEDLAAAVRLAAEGQRSLRGLPGAGPCTLVTEAEVPVGVDPAAFTDADSPEELASAVAGAGGRGGGTR